MKVNFTYLFFILTGFIFSVRLGAQEMKFHTREEIDLLVNPPLLEQENGILRFDSCRQYVGKLSENDAPQTYRFYFRNVSSSNVTITHITTSCGCTAASFDRKPVTPGERRMVSLTYNPQKRIGTIDTQAFVYTTLSNQKPVARLTLLGEVVGSDEWEYLPYSMGTLRVKNNKVFLPEIKPGQKPSVRILCGNSGKTPLRLSAQMLPGYATFHTEPTVIPPGQEADLVITVDGARLPESKRPLVFRFFVEGISARPSERMIDVNIGEVENGEIKK